MEAPYDKVTVDREFAEAEREAFAEQVRLLRELTDEERLALFFRDQGSAAWPGTLTAEELQRARRLWDRQRDEAQRRIIDSLA